MKIRIFKKLIILFLIINISIIQSLRGLNYITRWDFQKLCDWSFDPYPYFDYGYLPTRYEHFQILLDPKKVKCADIIFIRDVEKFFENVHPLITNPYIIVTHGHYRDAFLKEFTKYLEDKKIIAWFGIHSNINKHKKFYKVPLGIYHSLELYRNKYKFSILFKQLNNNKKDNLLYLNFTLKNHSDRECILDMFKNKNFCYKTNLEVPDSEYSYYYKVPDNYISYLEEMSKCKFTLAPRGKEVDTHRVWEAMCVGSVPIVKSSTLDSLYKDLPILIVKDWKQITEIFLNLKYKEIKRKKFNLPKLSIDYWFNKINKIRSKFLNFKFSRLNKVKNVQNK